MPRHNNSLVSKFFGLLERVPDKNGADSSLLMARVNRDGSEGDGGYNSSIDVDDLGVTVYDMCDDFFVLFYEQGQLFDVILVRSEFMDVVVGHATGVINVPEGLSMYYLDRSMVLLSFLPDDERICFHSN